MPSLATAEAPSEITPLHVLAVGAGLCGLSTAISVSLAGHKATILESMPRSHEFGAGLQCTPNGARLLNKWGVLSDLGAEAVKPTQLEIKRFNGRILAHRTEYDAEMYDRYQSPLLGLHRVDLQRALVKRSKDLGVHIRYSVKVIDFSSEGTFVVVEGGQRMFGDLIIAADGVWSTMRSRFLRKLSPPSPTGDMAYRMLIPQEDIEDSALLTWTQIPKVGIWLGPGAHAAMYPLKGGKLFNLILLVSDTLPDGQARAEGTMAEVLNLLEGWDPMLVRLVQAVKQVQKWRLMHVPPLKSWRDSSGRFVMAGDACHTILPYMSQGFNLAMEDAAALGSILSRVSSHKQVPWATAVYQYIRRCRTARMNEEARKHGQEFHLRDGPEQERRDLDLSDSFQSEKNSENRWSHPKIQEWIWTYDAYEEAEKAVAEESFQTYFAGR